MQLLQGHTKRVDGLAFSPDGVRLGSSSTDGTVCGWDTRTGGCTVLGRANWPNSRLAFSPDGSHLLVRAGGLAAWDAATGAVVKSLVPMTRATTVNGVAVAPASRLVAANDRTTDKFGHAVRVCDTVRGKSRVLLSSAPGLLSGLAFDPTGTRLATAVGVYDVASGERVVDAQFFGYWLDWCPTAPLLAATGFDRRVVVYDADTGQSVTTLSLEKKQVKAAAFSPDGAALAVVSNEEVVRTWDTRTWAERPALAWDIGRLTSLAFSVDGLRAACGSHRGTILVWDWDG